MKFEEAFRLLLAGKVVANETTKTVFKFDNDTLVFGKYTGDFNSVVFRAVGIIDTNGNWSEVIVEEETPRELLENFNDMFKKIDNRRLFNTLERKVIRECIVNARSREFDEKWLNGVKRNEVNGELGIAHS